MSQLDQHQTSAGQAVLLHECYAWWKLQTWRLVFIWVFSTAVMKAKKLQGSYKTHLSLFSVVLFLTQFTSDSVRKCKNRQRRKRDSNDKRPLMVSLSIDGRRSSLMDTELGRTFDLEVGPVHADCSCSIDTRYCFTYSPFNQSTNVYQTHF